MLKSPCPEHRRQGYAWTWDAQLRRSTLTCRGCGRPATEHESTAETIARLTAGNINLTEENR